MDLLYVASYLIVFAAVMGQTLLPSSLLLRLVEGMSPFYRFTRKGCGHGQSESRAAVLTLSHTASSQLLDIALNQHFYFGDWNQLWACCQHCHNHPRRRYPTHGGSLPFKVHTSSSWQVMQTFLPPFPLCNYPPATAWFRIPIHESQCGAKEGRMHEILEIVWEIPFRPDWWQLNPW